MAEKVVKQGFNERLADHLVNQVAKKVAIEVVLVCAAAEQKMDEDLRTKVKFKNLRKVIQEGVDEAFASEFGGID